MVRREEARVDQLKVEIIGKSMDCECKAQCVEMEYNRQWRRIAMFRGETGS